MSTLVKAVRRNTNGHPASTGDVAKDLGLTRQAACNRLNRAKARGVVAKVDREHWRVVEGKPKPR